MKKMVIITLVVFGTSLAVYAGVNDQKATEKTKTECCDKTKCCPTNLETKSCCTKSCD
ncbi:MAG: hypothetical protein V3U92_19255 [Cellulophaga sp.]